MLSPIRVASNAVFRETTDFVVFLAHGGKVVLVTPGTGVGEVIATGVAQIAPTVSPSMVDREGVAEAGRLPGGGAVAE